MREPASGVSAGRTFCFDDVIDPAERPAGRIIAMLGQHSTRPARPEEAPDRAEVGHGWIEAASRPGGRTGPSQLDAARPEAVGRVHQTGRLTARERLSALLDADSEVEYGAIAARTPDGRWVAEAGGVDFVGTIGGQTVIASSTDFTDRGGGYGAARLERLFALAHEHRWPVVFFVDGGGSRARHPRTGLDHLELNGPFGRFQLFDGIAELSGWVPTIAIVSGPGVRRSRQPGRLLRLRHRHRRVVDRHGRAAHGRGGPRSELSRRPNWPGSRCTRRPAASTCWWPTNRRPSPRPSATSASIGTNRRASPPRNAHLIADLVPDDGPYDMPPGHRGAARPRHVSSSCGHGSLVRSSPVWAASQGRSVGIIASQPLVAGGAIDQHAATKVARMVELCDAYEYPIISLIDTPGMRGDRHLVRARRRSAPNRGSIVGTCGR